MKQTKQQYVISTYLIAYCLISSYVQVMSWFILHNQYFKHIISPIKYEISLVCLHSWCLINTGFPRHPQGYVVLLKYDDMLKVHNL